MYGKAYAQAGGGGVNDSKLEAEFQGTVNKSKTMLKVVALAETFVNRPSRGRESFFICQRLVGVKGFQKSFYSAAPLATLGGD